MRYKQLAGPIALIILFVACVIAAGSVLASGPQDPNPPKNHGGGSMTPVKHYAGGGPIKRASSVQQDVPEQQSDGSLQTITKDGAGQFCPLKHTDVQAEISGFLARVSVTQEFTNPSTDKIEAIYTFPLPQNAAVDDMTMQVGGRTIKGLIKKREEAQKIYQQAVQAGHTTALLD